jgi:hypothetical protein
MKFSHKRETDLKKRTKRLGRFPFQIRSCLLESVADFSDLCSSAKIRG